MARRQQKETQASEAYYEQVRQALNHFADPDWLGTQSPLAAPYFLGAALQGAAGAETAVGRGRVLQQQLLLAADSLWTENLPADKDALVTAVNDERQYLGNKGTLYYFLLLELRYFRRYFRRKLFPTPQREQDIREFLGVGRGPYFNHIKQARQELGRALLSQLRPTFRLEQPWILQEPLLGREALLANSLGDLKANKTVAISGSGGFGKTSLGAALAAQWTPAACFWLTIRPTFNDQLSSLLFSLGHFLHQLGASNLWLQLVADGGKIDNYDLALAHLRGDLARLKQVPLLVIDEIDHLDGEPDRLTQNQIQVREFLTSLHGLAPLLLIGHRVFLSVDAHYPVQGFSEAETAVFLDRANISYTPEECKQLQAYTLGNPRLLSLVSAIYHSGNHLIDATQMLPQTPALVALFDYLWQRLNADERELLLELSVYLSAAPSDAFGDRQLLIEQFLAWGLVRQDGQGGLSLLPILADFLDKNRQWITADQREQNHVFAAQVRLERGEYTDAAYHYLQAGDPEKGIQAWFPNRQQEILRGKGAAALALFQQVSQRRLPKAEQEALALLRAELYELTGQMEQGLNELKTVRWPKEEETAVAAHLLRGNFLNALGRSQAALTAHDQGIATVSRLLAKLVKFRYERSVIQLQQREIDLSMREAQLAQYEVERLQGLLQEELGHYDVAGAAYERALDFAQQAGYKQGVAQTHHELARLFGRQANLDMGVEHAEKAIGYYEQVGDRLSGKKVRNALAAMYVQAGKHAEAAETAVKSFTFFKAAQLPFWTAVTAANLAESHYELGNLDQAEQYAREVIQTEEQHPLPYGLYTLGLIWRQRQAFEQAETHLRHSQKIASQNGDVYMEAYALRTLGELYLAHESRQAEAETTLRQALRQFEQLGIAQEVEATEALLTS
ncbi:MAG: hypothetical protein AAF614_11350 [Chloroflexota bacterium]